MPILRSPQTSASLFRQSRNMLLIGLLVVLSAGIAYAADKDPSVKACIAASKAVPGLDADDATDAYAQSNYERAVARLLKESRFRELECLADMLRSSKARFAYGDWKLSSFYEAVSQPLQHPTQQDWDFVLSQLKHWVSQQPTSITAQTALAHAYINYGWYARGDGTADTISRNGEQLFTQRINQARKILDSAAKLKTKCPEWYNTMQQIALAQGWSVQDARTLFEKAIAFEPSYYEYYRSLEYFLEPKWYGEAGDSENFAKEAADHIGGDDGDMVYAQIVSQIVCICGGKPALEKISWPRAQKGFALLESRYGISLYNLNRMAVIAWQVDDPETGEKILARLGDNWNKSVWWTQANFKLGRQWATELGPDAAKNRVVREEAEGNAKSAEGAEYKSTVEKTFVSLMQDCIQNAAPDLGKFVVTLRITKEGGIENMATESAGQANGCMYQKLLTLYNAGSKPFPVPAKPSYLVRMEIDGKGVTPVAAN